MTNLDLVFPQPEPVTLGGEPFRAIQFRLGDLARLQGVVRDLAGNPLAGRRVAIAAAKAACPGGDYLGESAEARRYAELLRGALQALKVWPPPLGGREAEALLGTGAGLVLWLDALLGRPGLNEGFTAATAARLLPDMTAEEYLALAAVAYADHPKDELLRRVELAPRTRRTFDWAKEIVEFSVERGWPPETVERLYLGQWWLWRSGGRMTPGRITGDRSRRRRVEARTRALLRGEPGRNGTH